MRRIIERIESLAKNNWAKVPDKSKFISSKAYYWPLNSSSIQIRFCAKKKKREFYLFVCFRSSEVVHVKVLTIDDNRLSITRKTINLLLNDVIIHISMESLTRIPFNRTFKLMCWPKNKSFISIYRKRNDVKDCKNWPYFCNFAVEAIRFQRNIPKSAFNQFACCVFACETLYFLDERAAQKHL